MPLTNLQIWNYSNLKKFEKELNLSTSNFEEGKMRLNLIRKITRQIDIFFICNRAMSLIVEIVLGFVLKMEDFLSIISNVY